MSEIEFLTELKKVVGEVKISSDQFLGHIYELLHYYTEKCIIPVINQKKVTVAVVELTTCGLISDLLTGESGASKFFSFGIIPYHSSTKQILNIPKRLLEYRGPGTVSAETAEALAINIMRLTGSKIGIAETGLLPSTELEKKRTKKRVGLVFVSIISEKKTVTRKLEVRYDLNRRLMRQEIAFRVLQSFKKFLEDE